MALLGANFSQQLAFTVTTTAGTIYTHGLGFTPTIVILTPAVVCATGTTPLQFCYSLATSTTITIIASPTSSAPVVDVLCGRLHSIIQ